MEALRWLFVELLRAGLEDIEDIWLFHRRMSVMWQLTGSGVRVRCGPPPDDDDDNNDTEGSCLYESRARWCSILEFARVRVWRELCWEVVERARAEWLRSFSEEKASMMLYI